jgi:hypothetical protein
MATSRVDRTTLVKGLAERGYNAALIHDGSWSAYGYYMLVKDSKGESLQDVDGGPALIWQEWDDPEHYEFVRDWFEGKIV